MVNEPQNISDGARLAHVRPAIHFADDEMARVVRRQHAQRYFIVPLVRCADVRTTQTKLQARSATAMGEPKQMKPFGEIIMEMQRSGSSGLDHERVEVVGEEEFVLPEVVNQLAVEYLAAMTTEIDLNTVEHVQRNEDDK